MVTVIDGDDEGGGEYVSGGGGKQVTRSIYTYTRALEHVSNRTTSYELLNATCVLRIHIIG